MECAVAFISVVIADLFILRDKDEETSKRMHVDITASKTVPSDENWSPATATTMDDEMSVMSDEEADFGSPIHSNIATMVKFFTQDAGGINVSEIGSRDELDASQVAAATRIQHAFRSFRCSRRIAIINNEESFMCKQRSFGFESLTELYQRPESCQAKIPKSGARLSSFHPNLEPASKRGEGKGTPCPQPKNSYADLCTQKGNCFQSSTDSRRHHAALSIQSKFRGYITRVMLKQTCTSKDGEASLIQSNIGGCISRSSFKEIKQRDMPVSVKSPFQGFTMHSSRKISLTLSRNVLVAAPSDISNEVLDGNHFTKFTQPKSEGRVRQFPTRLSARTGEQEAKDFRSILSFWELMASQSQQQRTQNSPKNPISRRRSIGFIGTKWRNNKQRKESENTSAIRLQNCFRRYMLKKEEYNAAIQIQRQARILISKQKVEKIRKVKRKTHHSHSAHINGNKIQEFVSHFSEARHGSQKTRDGIATSTLLARAQMSLFEPSLSTGHAWLANRTISQGIQQEDFWKTQRVILQQRPR